MRSCPLVWCGRDPKLANGFPAGAGSQAPQGPEEWPCPAPQGQASFPGVCGMAPAPWPAASHSSWVATARPEARGAPNTLGCGNHGEERVKFPVNTHILYGDTAMTFLLSSELIDEAKRAIKAERWPPSISLHLPSFPPPTSSPQQGFRAPSRLMSCPHPRTCTILHESVTTQSKSDLLLLPETLTGSLVPSETGLQGPLEAGLAGFSVIHFSCFLPRALSPDSSPFSKPGCLSCWLCNGSCLGFPLLFSSP